MNIRLSLLAVMLSLLACNFLGGSGSAPQPAAPEPDAIQATSIAGEDLSSTSFTIKRIHSQNGSLSAQLAEQAKEASSLDQKPFIEFDASWCPPCQAIDASIRRQDSLTLQAFAGVYLIRADVDEWGWGDGRIFKFEAIPVYYKLDGAGLPSGASIDGGAWREDIPENFAPVLAAFFHAP